MAEPLEQLYGRVVAVERVSEGSVTVVGATIGATTLSVVDVADFDDDGGTVLIGGETYEYLAIDEEADTVTLATGLLAAVDVDDLVKVVGPDGVETAEYVAMVLLDDQDPTDEPIEVTVPHELVDYLHESVRAGASEGVTLVRDGEDDWTIWQINGKVVSNLVIEKVKGGFEGTLQDIYDEANTAAQAALEAATKADFALETANGKIHWSLNPPGATANNVGDVWFQKDSSTQNIIGQWEGQGGNTWVSVQLRNEVIANLDAGKLVAGSAFVNGLWVLTNFTLGNASTDGVIQSYDFANSSVGVFINKDGLVAKGGTITGATINGASFVGGTFAGVTAMTSNLFQTTPQSSIGVKIGSGGVTSYDGSLRGQKVYVTDPDSPGAGTAANVYMASDGNLTKIVSSERYKENITPADLDPATILALEPKVYSLKTDPFKNRGLGFLAEEAEALGLVDFLEYDEQARPDGFRYATWVVALQVVARFHQQRADQLEGRVAALEDRVAALERLLNTSGGA